MNRKKIGKLIIIIGILALIGYFAFLFWQSTSDQRSLPVRDLDSSPFDDPELSERDFTERPEPTRTPPVVIDDSSDDINITEADMPILFQITDFPVTAARLLSSTETRFETISEIESFEQPDGTVIRKPITKDIEITEDIARVRFNRKSDGVIFEADLSDTRSIGHEQLTGGTVENAEEGVFTKDGDNFILRFFNPARRKIQTVLGALHFRDIDSICPYTFDKVLKIGDTGASVENVQNVIIRAGIPHDSTKLTSGLFDEETVELVKKFQRLVGQHDDGILGAETRKAVLDQCEIQEERLAQANNEVRLPATVDTIFLQEDISELIYNEKADRYFYIAEEAEKVKGYVVNGDGNVASEVFKSDFTDWRAFWSSDNSVDLIPKASMFATGFYYRYNLAEKKLLRLLGPENGLMGRPTYSGDYILSSVGKKNGITSSLFSKVANSSNIIGDVMILADKCIPSISDSSFYCAGSRGVPNGEYPDDWYIGKVNLNDSLWKIDNESGISSEIMVPDNLIPGTSLDIIDMQFSTDGRVLIFKDKKTNYLWGYMVQV